jgi:hypothetical protein
MRRLSAAEVHAKKTAELGLDPTTLDLTSTESVAGALRRAASFLCPCTSATLVRGVVPPLRGLVSDLDATKGLVEETLEAMIAHGDILEHNQTDEDSVQGKATLLYAAPPSFIPRESGAVILLGIASDHLCAVPDELESRIEYVTYVRRLSPLPTEDLRSELLHLGLIELSNESWLKAPPGETAAQHVSRFDRLLDAAQPSRDIPGLSLLDPGRPVQYYRGRWVEPRSQSGRFVARRSQAYGADLWCFVELQGGHPERMIDFPVSMGRWRGCDEAWSLQMAIDATRGDPQRYRVREGPGGSRLLEFFSPVPMWARRRWDAIGEPVPSSGCLFAYRLTETELAEELQFLRVTLWLDEVTVSPGRR